MVVDHRVAVDPLARDVRLDRDASPLLDHVAADDAGVVRRAAGEDDDPAQLAQLLVGHPEPFELEPAAPGAVADRLAQRVGLLVDLLQHEGLVAALLGALVVPVEHDLVVDDLAAVDVGEDGAVGRDRHDLAVVREEDGAGLAQECGGVRGEEHLPLADADDERAEQARPDEQVGMVVVDRDEREVPFELGARLRTASTRSPS